MHRMYRTIIIIIFIDLFIIFINCIGYIALLLLTFNYLHRMYRTINLFINLLTFFINFLTFLDYLHINKRDNRYIYIYIYIYINTMCTFYYLNYYIF